MKNRTAVLGQTKDSNLTIYYSIDIGDHTLSSSKPCCYNCPRNSASCLTFSLNKIVENAENNDQEYEEMAKTGANIEITIDWKCHKPFYGNFDPSRDCEVDHSFSRRDHQDISERYKYYPFLTRVITSSIDDKFRTVRYYYLLKLVIKPKAKLTYINYYQFFTNCFAYSGAFHIAVWLFKWFVKNRVNKYNKVNIEEILNLGQLEQEYITLNRIQFDDYTEEELGKEVNEKSSLLNPVTNSE